MRTVGLVAGLVLMASRAYAVDALCGMFVPPGETAVMSGDLDCTTGGVGIYLGPKSTLDLNGFTLTVAEDMIAVFCQHQSCAVVSRAVAPGVLEGNGEAYYWLIPNLQPDERPTVRKLLSGNPIDIDSERRPRLTSTTCDHSNWDVCALD